MLDFGKRLEIILKQRKISQSELSKHLGIDVRMVNRWIRQGVTPQSKYLYNITEYLNVEPDYLLGKVEEPSAKKYSIRDFTTDELLAELKRRIEAP